VVDMRSYGFFDRGLEEEGGRRGGSGMRMRYEVELILFMLLLLLYVVLLLLTMCAGYPPSCLQDIIVLAVRVRPSFVQQRLKG